MDNFNYIDLEKYRDQIEAVKIMVIGLPATCNASPDEVLGKSIHYIYKISETDEKDYSNQVLVLIQAYLEMGFLYKDRQELFDHILDSLDINKNLQLKQEYIEAERIQADRMVLKKLIGTWPQTEKKGYTSDKIVDIILEYMSKKETGVHHFEARNKNNIVMRNFELVILDKECYLHNILKKKYYIFENKAGEVDV